MKDFRFAILGPGFRARYHAWADPRCALVHSSRVACHRDLLNAIPPGTAPETSAADDLKTGISSWNRQKTRLQASTVSKSIG